MPQPSVQLQMMRVSHVTRSYVQLCSYFSGQARKAESLTEFCWEARLIVDMLATRLAAMLPSACAKAIRRTWTPKQISGAT
jgi:hypothetical protein